MLPSSLSYLVAQLNSWVAIRHHDPERADKHIRHYQMMIDRATHR